MKKLGIVGGVAWPSTVDYYRAICRLSIEHHRDLGISGPSPMPEMIGMFSLADKSALALLLWNGLAWAVGACVLACLPCLPRPSTKALCTYPLDSSVVRWRCILVDARAGIAAAVVGSIAVIALRRRRR